MFLRLVYIIFLTAIIQSLKRFYHWCYLDEYSILSLSSLFFTLFYSTEEVEFEYEPRRRVLSAELWENGAGPQTALWMIGNGTETQIALEMMKNGAEPQTTLQVMRNGAEPRIALKMMWNGTEPQIALDMMRNNAEPQTALDMMQLSPIWEHCCSLGACRLGKFWT